jgi:glycosyltransferase involved in cell wall biosynthesis
MSNIKNNKKIKKTNNSEECADLVPFVSICTPTFNRRPFIPFMIKCFEHQTYPKDRIEWIIIDDGTDPIVDLVTHIPQVKYTYYKEKMLLGRKRNLMHNKCSGDIIIYMDDDDYYPPERISHAVQTLLDNPTYLIAGSSEMYIYFDSKQKVYRCGPYKEYHSTAATFAFKKELLLETCFNDENALAEERYFLKNYTIPLIQLDSLKSIIVFSHKHNSLNKEKLLDNLDMTRTVVTDYNINDLISDPILKQFYIKNMNNLLEAYEQGKPEYKPKLMEQLKKMEDERNKRIQHHNEMLTSQQKLLTSLQGTTSNTNIKEIEAIKQHYDKQLSDKTYLINELLKKIKALTIELDECKIKIKNSK